jgi:hypothetical protein
MVCIQLSMYIHSFSLFRIACPVWSPPVTLILLIILALEGVSFTLFTVIMTGIQLYSIYTDTTVRLSDVLIQ